MVQVYDPTNPEVELDSTGNYQFRIDVADNDKSGTGEDRYEIIALDNKGIVYYEAADSLSGGNILLHQK